MSDHKRTIMVIDDEVDIISILDKYLSDEGFLVEAVYDGTDAAARAAKVMPDLIILDVKLPGKDGYQVKAELNRNEMTATIPVIFLSSSVSTMNKVKGLNLSADDYVTKPFDVLELLARIHSVLNRRKHYEEIVTKDSLTGLPNVSFFKKELAIAFDMAKRYGRIFTVGFIDIDHFKEINDTFGHLIGDRVLKEAAKRMARSLRQPDILSRYGGDEFCMIMREATGLKAQVALNRLKKGIESNSFHVDGENKKIPVSISVGMATYEDSFSTFEELIALADENMYRNKNGNAVTKKILKSKPTVRKVKQLQRPAV